MKYDCPLCAADLKGVGLRKVPRPGEFKFLALRWHLECPHCLGELMIHQHPRENITSDEWSATSLLVGFFVWIVSKWITDTRIYWVALISVILYYCARVRYGVPKDWQRYAVWQEKKFKK